MPTFVTVVAALAGAYLFEQLGVPAGSLLGGVAGVAGVNLLASFDAVELPGLPKFLALALLGWVIGQGVTKETMAALGESLPVIGITVVALVVVGGLLAWLLTATGLTDANTAYLTTSPGALSQMAALATDTGADSLLVTTTHTIRVIAVVILAPIVTNLLANAPPT